MILTGTNNTPYIHANLSEGYFTIKGRSSPERSLDFYQPIIDHIAGTPCSTPELKLDVSMEYFNTSSCKCLINIFKEFKKNADANGSTLNVNWYAEEDDEDMIEAGEDFQDLLDLEFNFLGYDEEVEIEEKVEEPTPIVTSNQDVNQTAVGEKSMLFFERFFKATSSLK